jgi:hypothetical protein
MKRARRGLAARSNCKNPESQPVPTARVIHFYSHSHNRFLREEQARPVSCTSHLQKLHADPNFPNWENISHSIVKIKI